MTGIICATETEMKAIINEIEDIKENKIGRITFFEGKFNDKDIVFVQSGIGKVNAAVTATLLIEKYDIDENKLIISEKDKNNISFKEYKKINSIE